MDDPLARLEGLAAIDHEIADLEARLRDAKLRRQQQHGTSIRHSDSSASRHQQQQRHFLFLLSDSALPLGSFAFSSGLESFLAHDKAAAAASAATSLAAAANAIPKGIKSGPEAFAAFLPLSVSSYAYATLPFVLAAHDAASTVTSAAAVAAAAASSNFSETFPSTVEAFTSALTLLDDTYDATIICTVGRRASVAQGRALLSVWERAFSPTLSPSPAPPLPSSPSSQTSQAAQSEPAIDPLRPFALLVKRSSNPRPGTLSEASAHMPPLFGAVAALAGLDRRQAADVFILSHVKALLSAAVRANLVGPYQAQRLLASAHVQQLVVRSVEGAWDVPVEEAGQTMPVVDLWMGRHEMLYSRIFNS
ncbi:urease accessory protein [Sporothrix schenckii 1099-18]|uniref:Urease accessory protein UreF n=2 Tax=Sporothrix schenckii TaxID=29908 RepID=U7Q6D2_SPOS1|nr:urease accessory protein [Sporothrix schenckii 1099-18]ERT02296.1 hypothetical protein HMPREF1624_00594 [Sporothrix schenckii ATCC 58251]KJR80455.1 urease accessory protein [Sporothrix schenckii 1099-18]